MQITEPFKVTVNAQHEFELHPSDVAESPLVKEGAFDLVEQADGSFHILHQGKSYHATLIETDYAKHEYVFLMNGSRFTVHISDHYDRLVKQLGLHTGSNQKANHIKAPMPGLVLNILVEAGMDVHKGDALLILEAMKMENVIKAAGDGKVKAVKVEKGAAVDKGQLLIEMD
ncbi:MAG: acetyl-CoA carboxylase biotin carboxyl carrier protein subunit [Saprospiraceae bacterium]|nr:acetyl-CoA carboxylase biotin carboxyl carrier protein subunit [Saprospiraceae bacterium]